MLAQALLADTLTWSLQAVPCMRISRWCAAAACSSAALSPLATASPGLLLGPAGA